MTIPRYILMFVFMVLLSLSFVGIRVQVLRLGYSLSAAGELSRALLHENSQLKIECATLKNPERVERIARDDMAMIYPDPEHVVQVGK